MMRLLSYFCISVACTLGVFIVLFFMAKLAFGADPENRYEYEERYRYRNDPQPVYEKDRRYKIPVEEYDQEPFLEDMEEIYEDLQDDNN